MDSFTMSKVSVEYSGVAPSKLNRPRFMNGEPKSAGPRARNDLRDSEFANRPFYQKEILFFSAWIPCVAAK